MPTGYTHIIEDRDDVTFREFIWRCARAFGACVMQRDSGLDAPVVLTDKPSSYHQDSIARALELKDSILKASDESLLAKEEIRYSDAVEAWQRALEEGAHKSAKYAAMLEQVRAWKPPTPEHNGLRDFMISQIMDSVKWLGTPFEPSDPCTDAVELRRRLLEKADDDIQYHTEKHQAEVAAYEARNEWLQQLVKSVGTPPQNER